MSVNDRKMRSFRFVIPIKLEDLLQSSGHLDVYSVQIEYNAREIPHKLNGEYDLIRPRARLSADVLTTSSSI